MLTDKLNNRLPEKYRTQKIVKTSLTMRLKIFRQKSNLKKLAHATGCPQIHKNFHKTCKIIKSNIRSK